jgi:hypothetical protein
MSSVASLCAVMCLFAGDSLAVGLARATGLPSVAIGGISTVHPSIIDAVRRAAPGTVLLVSDGTNDARPAGEAAARVSAEAHARGVRLMWSLPPCHGPVSLDARSRLRAAEIAAAAAAAGVETVALRDLPAGACGTPRAPDGIHLTSAGYRALASQVFKLLAR